MQSINKEGELVWDKLGTWILLLILLVVVLIIVFGNKEKIVDALDNLKTVLRFGG